MFYMSLLAQVLASEYLTCFGLNFQEPVKDTKMIILSNTGLKLNPCFAKPPFTDPLPHIEPKVKVLYRKFALRYTVNIFVKTDISWMFRLDFLALGLL